MHPRTAMKKILFLTDGSAYATEAAKYIRWLGTPHPVQVTAAYLTDPRILEIPHVVGIGGVGGMQTFNDLSPRLRQAEDEKARLIAGQTRKDLETVPEVSSLEFLHKVAPITDFLKQAETGMDLVVLGKRGETAKFDAEHLGSNLERALRSSTKPCLVTNRAFREIRTILVAFDDSPTARKALEWICTEPQFSRCALHIATVAEGGHEDEAATILKAGEILARSWDAKPTCQMLGGLLEPSISNYVDANAIDLVVMGAYGHNRIRHLVIGSATTTVMSTSKVPFLCFR